MSRTKNLDTISKVILVIALPFFYSVSYSLFDFPQAFEEPLIETFQISAVEVTSLDAINASFTIPVDFLMVKILQKYKLKQTAVFFALISALGTFLTHLAIPWTNYKILVLARLFYGIGLESLYVVSGVGVEKWFKVSEIILVNGLARVELKLVNTLMVFLMPYLYVAFDSLTAPMLALELMSLVLVFNSILFYIIETRYEG